MRRLVLPLTFIFISTLSAFSQNASPAANYLDNISKQGQLISKKYLSYMSEAAHGSKLKKLEQKRKEMLTTLRGVQANATKLKPFKGDTTLKKSYERYITILNSVFNEDYGKIVNMEEIAEESYDQMEAYLLAQERAEEKLNEAFGQFDDAYDKFAANNKINLIQSDDKMSRKMKKIGEANQYYHRKYLVFFKVFKQEAYLIDAVSKKDVNGIEQNKNTLLKYATEAVAKLDTAKPFRRDQSLIAAGKKYAQFAKTESERLGFVSDYVLKMDEFEKIKKAFEAKSSKSQAEVKEFNQRIDQTNKLIDQYNQQIQQLDKGRNQALNGWNGSVKEFFESYIPKEK
ncbi:MAG TPA: hypothetical protein VL728_04915 [Cyclobacteriaceae bacterium]|jgi:hypothetical protein|nr:hypothetical protein [Cyclobacteriaceae bacterium]